MAINAVLRIRNFLLEPDPELLFRIQHKIKEQIKKKKIFLTVCTVGLLYEIEQDSDRW